MAVDEWRRGPTSFSTCEAIYEATCAGIGSTIFCCFVCCWKATWSALGSETAGDDPNPPV